MKMLTTELVATGAFLLELSGCATITKSPDQTVSVNTKPAGAECTLTREGKIIAVINPTPGSINVQKDKDPIRVTCKKQGFLDNTGEMSSEFEAMTFGNIIFGGLIGVGVDAVSGAMHEYPPLVTITLIPEQFESTVTRDAFFDAMRDDLMEESTKVSERVKRQCAEDECERQLKAVEEARLQKVNQIEAQRMAAKVTGTQ
jgi:hypothetical protein